MFVERLKAVVNEARAWSAPTPAGREAFEFPCGSLEPTCRGANHDVTETKAEAPSHEARLCDRRPRSARAVAERVFAAARIEVHVETQPLEGVIAAAGSPDVVLLDLRLRK